MLNADIVKEVEVECKGNDNGADDGGFKAIQSDADVHKDAVDEICNRMNDCNISA